MDAHSQTHHEKVKITIESTHDERACIMMEAIQELRESHGIKCESIDDFWEKMGMNPHA